MQSFVAAWLWALLTARSASTAADLGIPPLLSGSGKFGTPCERIQEEYDRSPIAPGAPALPAAEEPAAAVVVEPVATPGVEGPPPHAATAAPTARTPPAIIAVRRKRHRHLGIRWVPGEMSCMAPPG